MSEPAAVRVLHVSVRRMVEFLLRSGDLHPGFGFRKASRALEGANAHRKLQSTRPDGYISEQSVAATFEYDGWQLKVRGRIDGIYPSPTCEIIEEIKSTQGMWEHASADPLHLAQARVYAALRLDQAPREMTHCKLVYYDLETEQEVTFDHQETATACREFFQKLVADYSHWLERQVRWIKERNGLIREGAIPYGGFRGGQHTMAETVYRAIRRGRRSFIEAPTGIGKTMAALFPATKALGHEECDRIFYVTARTVGRFSARDALAELATEGMQLRASILTAKDRICFCASAGKGCDPANCTVSTGHYDRVLDALREVIGGPPLWDEHRITEVAQQHQVCPFELSLDASQWADVVVCDYNYVFDPRAQLKRHFAEDAAADIRQALLCDEAHQLPDRAREMFSASLDREKVQQVAQIIRPRSLRLSRLANVLALSLTDETGSTHLPEQVQAACEDFHSFAADWMAENNTEEPPAGLLDLWFEVAHLLRMNALTDGEHVWITDGTAQLRCLDPGPFLRETLQRTRAAVFFSATLSPPEHFQLALGSAGDFLQLPSPFPQENLQVLISQNVDTRLVSRENTLPEVVRMILCFLRAKRGNYLLFFPSYEYLLAVETALRDQLPEAEVQIQAPGMNEAERAAFIGAFRRPGRPVLAFAVLGGLFSEGIDLRGEQLVGTVIVGTGLPPGSPERDQLQQYYEARGLDGFQFAREIPGMIKVLQAAGRVIRSETDAGVVLLIDSRFAKSPLRNWMPTHWSPVNIRNVEALQSKLSEFWESREGSK